MKVKETEIKLGKAKGIEEETGQVTGVSTRSEFEQESQGAEIPAVGTPIGIPIVGTPHSGALNGPETPGLPGKPTPVKEKGQAVSNFGASSRKVRVLFKELELNDIEPNPYYFLDPASTETSADRAGLLDRLKGFFEEGQFGEFVALVRPHPVRAGKYQLAYGHLRLTAARQAGLTHIATLVEPLSDDAMLRRLIQENQSRAELSRLELAGQIRHLRDNFGSTYKELGEFFNLPLNTVYELYYLTLAPAHFLEFVRLQPHYYQAVSEMVRLDLTQAGQKHVWDYIQTEKPSPRQVRNKIKELLAATRK